MKRFLISTVLGSFLATSPHFALALEPEEEGAAASARVHYVFKWEHARPLQRGLLFKFIDGVSDIKKSLVLTNDIWASLSRIDTEEGLRSCLEMSKGSYEEEMLRATTKILQEVESFNKKLREYYQENKALIHSGVDREAQITLQIRRFSDEIAHIFRPFVDSFKSIETLHRAFLSPQSVKVCSGIFQEAQDQLNASFVSQNSESLKALLYAEYGSQPTEDQKRAIEAQEFQKGDAQRAASAEAGHAQTAIARAQEEKREAERRLRIGNFEQRFGAFFYTFQAHVDEKLENMRKRKAGKDEGIMCFFAPDSLQFLRDTLKPGGILEDVSSAFYGIQVGKDPSPIVRARDILVFVEKAGIRETAAFEGGLRKVQEYDASVREFPLMSPQKAFLRPLNLLKALHEKFPKDERVNTAVVAAFTLIEDQNGKCPAGLLGRSFMLSNTVIRLLREGIEAPFVE